MTVYEQGVLDEEATQRTADLGRASTGWRAPMETQRTLVFCPR